MRGLVRVARLAIVLAGAAGCASAPPSARRAPVERRTAEEALARLRERAASFRSVRGILELTWRDSASPDGRSCGASFSWVRPDSLRVRGTSAAFFAVFDLVSDGRRVTVDLPREGVAITGDCEDPAWAVLPLSERDIRIALSGYPVPRGVSAAGSVAWDPVEPGRLLGTGWTLDLHPDSGWPAVWREEASPGREIRWHDWRTRDGVAWPSRIILGHPDRGELLELRMGRLHHDGPVAPGRFTLEIPGDRETITPGEAKTRWTRGAFK